MGLRLRSVAGYGRLLSPIKQKRTAGEQERKRSQVSPSSLWLAPTSAESGDTLFDHPYQGLSPMCHRRHQPANMLLQLSYRERVSKIVFYAYGLKRLVTLVTMVTPLSLL